MVIKFPHEEFWMQCPCGSTKFEIKVDAPDFTQILSLVCANNECRAEVPIEFENAELAEKETANV